MEITKREIIISVAIAAVMLIVGFFISGKITDMQNDKNAEYQKAVHIEDSELFRYGMDTNVGNAILRTLNYFGMAWTQMLEMPY